MKYVILTQFDFGILCSLSEKNYVHGSFVVVIEKYLFEYEFEGGMFHLQLDMLQEENDIYLDKVCHLV